MHMPVIEDKLFVKENNVYICWDFTRDYLHDPVKKIPKLLTENPS